LLTLGFAHISMRILLLWVSTPWSHLQPTEEEEEEAEAEAEEEVEEEEEAEGEVEAEAAEEEGKSADSPLPPATYSLTLLISRARTSRASRTARSRHVQGAAAQRLRFPVTHP